MKFFGVLCLLCGLVLPAVALDREAFTFTAYNLDGRIEPEQQRLAVRGKIALRNDSNAPQNALCLQISSTLGWRSIGLNGRPLQFVSQSYVSDIDHTGSLSEAIVSLPTSISPKGTVELEIGYEGTIPLDTTRLTRIGIPEDTAKHSDWDQISKSFTAVRGVGYVAWYPVAMESANLSEGDSVFESLARWKSRHSETRMSVAFTVVNRQPIWFSGAKSSAPVANPDAGDPAARSEFEMVRFGIDVPTFVVANYQTIPARGNSGLAYSAGAEESAKAYAAAMEKLDPIVAVGRGSGTLKVIQLPDPSAAAFTTQGILLTPLKPSLTPDVDLTLVYALARQLVSSPRPWIQEGLAHYAQVAHIEQTQGRGAALEYLEARQSLLIEAEKPNRSDPAGSRPEVGRSLVNAPDDIYLQTKAMYVWWMLRDLLGNSLPTLLDYRASDDNEPSYMQRLIEARTRRDLEWFLDDWVYRDRGLPDFHIESVYPRETLNGTYVVTVTVENLGGAGAEVPVTLHFAGGESTKRLEVRGKSKGVIRIEAPSSPQDVTVNDGSVPESDLSNNTFKVLSPPKE